MSDEKPPAPLPKPTPPRESGPRPAPDQTPVFRPGGTEGVPFSDDGPARTFGPLDDD